MFFSMQRSSFIGHSLLHWNSYCLHWIVLCQSPCSYDRILFFLKTYSRLQTITKTLIVQSPPSLQCLFRQARRPKNVCSSLLLLVYLPFEIGAPIWPLLYRSATLCCRGMDVVTKRTQIGCFWGSMSNGG